jgi:hypothetical protein
MAGSAGEGAREERREEQMSLHAQHYHEKSGSIRCKRKESQLHEGYFNTVHGENSE